MNSSEINLLKYKAPSFESWNLFFYFENNASNFFPINEGGYEMFLRFIDSLFFFLKIQIELGLLERPFKEGGRPDFGSFSSQVEVYQIFFDPFHHWLYISATGVWLSEVHDEIEKHETLNDYLQSDHCVNAEITLFMLQFEYALNILYSGRDIRGIGGPCQ